MSNLKFEIKSTTWVDGSNEKPQETVIGTAYNSVYAESIFNVSVEEKLAELGYNDGKNVSFEKDDEMQNATIIDLDKKCHYVYSISIS